MTNDFGRLFGALAIKRGLVSPQQISSLLKNVGDAQPLDAQMVRAGWVSASARLEILSEMDSQVLAASGDVESAIQSVRSQSAEVEEFISLYESSVRTNPNSSSNPGDNDAILEETIVRPEAALVDQIIENKAGGTSGSGKDSAGSELGPHSETVISQAPQKDEQKRESQESNPLDGTLIYQAPSARGKLNDPSRTEGGGAPDFGDTVDSKPEYHSRYTLTQVHGEGGLGQVWLATDPSLKREIALKRIRPGKDGSRDAQLRLIKEAQITGQLEHPNIIPVYELEHADSKGRPFYTMKFLRGKTLHEKIQAYHKKRKEGNDEPLDLVNLLNAFIDTCYALAYAGARGVVHRDLKPQNIMVGDFGEVLVLDWGLAKKVGQPDDDFEKREIELAPVLDETATHVGGVIGTPAYMAPEQAAGRNDHVDARTDVYGLGAVLFCILAGISPHRGNKTKNRIKDTQDLLTRISVGATPSVRDLDPTIPRSLDAICAKAMSHSHKERYPDARELANDVQRFIADEKVSVVTESWQERAGRWLRKNRAWAKSILMSSTVVLVVAISAAVLVNNARKNEIIAHDETREAKDAAEQAQKEATEFFLSSRRTVDTLYRELSDSLSEYPAVQRLRVKLLEEAASEYEQLAETRSEIPELRLEAAKSLVRLGEVWRLLRDFERAKSSFENAQSKLEMIAKEEPTNISAATELVTCINGLGLAWATTAPLEQAAEASTQADKYYEQSLESLETLLSRLDAETAEGKLLIRQLKARILANRGSLLSRTDRLDESLQYLSEAEAEFRAIAELDDQLNNLHEHAKSLVVLSGVLSLHGRDTDAKTSLEESISIYSRLVAANPDNTRFLSGRADARLTLANVMSGDDVLSARLGIYQECVDDYLLLIQSRPDVPAYRSNLVTAETNIAQVLYQQGENKQAGEHAYTALEQVLVLVDADSSIVESHSLEIYVRVTYGQILRDSGSFIDAETAFTSALEKCLQLTNADSDELSDNANILRLQAETKNSLGVLFLVTNRAELAQQAFASAREDFKKTLEVSPNATAVINGHGWASSYLGDALRMLGRNAEASAMYDESLNLRRPLTTDDQTASFDVVQSTIRLLNDCQDESKRNYVLAMQLAERLAAKYPKSGKAHVLLASCHFRQENYELAIAELDEAKLFNLGNRSPAGFLRTMALWKLGEKTKAQAAFKQAVGITESHTPGNLRLLHVRAEAEALLGITAESDSDENAQ